MLDLTRTTWGRIFEKDVLVGSTIGAEGRVVQRTLVGGLEFASESAGGGAEDIIGFSLMSTITPSEMCMVEGATIPATAAYTVQLSKTSLVATQIRVYDVTGAVDLTEGNPGVAAQYSVADATGLMTFNVAQASHVLIIWYRYNPTVLEARQLWYEGQVNRDSWTDYTKVGVGCGKSIIYTTEYNPLVDYSAGALSCFTGGWLSIGGGGAAITGDVISVPTADDNYLGVEVNI